MRLLIAFMLGAALLVNAGCMTAGKHREAVRDDIGDKITAGVVQKEIKVGMPSADVVGILGSPNMVTTDAQRREVWVYDKVSTEQVYSTSSGGVGVLGLVLGGSGGGAGAGTYSGSSGAASSTQRTLTIIIKYDEQGLVRDFAYRQSSF